MNDLWEDWVLSEVSNMHAFVWGQREGSVGSVKWGLVRLSAKVYKLSQTNIDRCSYLVAMVTGYHGNHNNMSLTPLS